jgi:hypothetical protein
MTLFDWLLLWIGINIAFVLWRSIVAAGRPDIAELARAK